MNNDKLQNDNLWDRVRSKDKKAFEQFYEQYFSSLLFYGLSIGFNMEIVEDCIQDLFVKIFTAKSLPEVNNVESYLFKSLRNSLTDKVQESQKQIEWNDDITDSLLFDDEYIKNIFKDSDEDIQNSHLLIKCYNQLNENQKSAIYLHFARNLSWEKMSIVLNISPHSCMNLVARAIVKLRLLFENETKNKK